MPEFEIEHFDEVSRTITYDFQIMIDGKHYSGSVSGHIAENEIIATHKLRWDTPGHPELDEQEEQTFIDLLFVNL